MINLGIMGGGNISETHARAAREIEGVEIAAIYGERHDKASRLSKLYGGTTYRDLNDFLNHKPLDIVAIGSPSGVHAEHGIAAARRGLHVLVEKPIAINTRSADVLIAECEKAGVRLGVFFQDRVAPDICRLKNLLASDRLGELILASARVKWHRPAEYYGNSSWRGTWMLDGGGALMNQGIHTVDLLIWLLGDIVRVYAKAVTALHRIEVEDTLVATLEFANGVIGTLEVSTATFPGYPRRLELTGTEGTIILENDRLISADLRSPLAIDWGGERETNSNASETSPVVSEIAGHRRILEDFLRAILTNSKPRCDGYEGRRSVAVVEAIYASSRASRAVMLTGSVAEISNG